MSSPESKLPPSRGPQQPRSANGSAGVPPQPIPKSTIPAAALKIDPQCATGDRKPASRSLRHALIAAMVASGFAMAMVGSWLVHRGGRVDRPRPVGPPRQERPDPQGVVVDPTDAATASTAPQATGNRGAVAEPRKDRPTDLFPDDGRLLWASPTAGPPLNLAYVPTSAKFFVNLRAAQWLAHDEGRRTLRAMGPVFHSHLDRWQQQAGVRLDQIDRLTLGWAPEPSGMPRPVSVIWTTTRLTPPPGERRVYQDQVYLLAGEVATYQPPEREGHVTVMGAESLVQEVMEQGAAPPLLRRELNLLRQESDDARQLTILFPPNFLLFDGRPLFGSSLGQLGKSLETIVGDDVQAGLLSFHLGDHYDFYGELRLLGRADSDPRRSTLRLKGQLDRVPEEVQKFLAGHQVADYWRPIADRFGKMLVFVRQRLRFDTEQGQTIVNFVVPAPAAHNLMLASELALATSAATGSSVAESGPLLKANLEQLLQQRTSLEFSQRSLEMALEELEGLVRETMPGGAGEFRIEIMGQDLQVEGITRNQQVKGFRQVDQTIAQILTAIMMTANPVTTVTDPSQADQRLVWCVVADPQRPGGSTVAVTTRTAATEKGYELPQDFLEK